MKRAEWSKMQIAAAAPRRAEIAMLYLGGCTLQEIGDAIGMTRERVRQLVRAAGVPPRQSRVDVGPILRAYDPSKTTVQIATEAGCNRRKTWAILRSLKLARRHLSRKWTRERIVAQLQKWARKHGRQPTAPELWNAPGFPNPNTVRSHFGKWNAAIRAAGFKPLRVGHKLSERVSL